MQTAPRDAGAASGVQTAIGVVKPGDILSVRWDDNRWCAASVAYCSVSRGIGLVYPECDKYKKTTDVYAAAEVNEDSVRRGETLETANVPVTTVSLPVNLSRIPAVGDRVEVEFDEAPNGAPQSDFVVYNSVCIYASRQVATGSAAAQRLGFASSSGRLPTRFRVKFDACGTVSDLVRGKHRWRVIE